MCRDQKELKTPWFTVLSAILHTEAHWVKERTEFACCSLAVWFAEICTLVERPSHLSYADNAQVYERVYLHQGIESTNTVEKLSSSTLDISE